MIATKIGATVDNKIYVINDGQVAGEGKHEELLVNSKIYKNFYEKQIKRS